MGYDFETSESMEGQLGKTVVETESCWAFSAVWLAVPRWKM